MFCGWLKISEKYFISRNKSSFLRIYNFNIVLILFPNFFFLIFSVLDLYLNFNCLAEKLASKLKNSFRILWKIKLSFLLFPTKHPSNRIIYHPRSIEEFEYIDRFILSNPFARILFLRIEVAMPHRDPDERRNDTSGGSSMQNGPVFRPPWILMCSRVCKWAWECSSCRMVTRIDEPEVSEYPAFSLLATCPFLFAEVEL